MDWGRYLTLLWIQAPPPAFCHTECFFNEAHCAWRLVTYFWKLFSLFFFCLSFFFFFFVKGFAYILAWEHRGAGKRTVSPLCGLAATVADFWNVSQSFSVWKRPSVAMPHFFFFFQSWGGCCHAPSPILAGAKKVSQAPFRVFNPHICFPESFCLCC